MSLNFPHWHREQRCSAPIDGVSCASPLQTNCSSLNVFVLLDYDFVRLTEATGSATALHRAASHCTGLPGRCTTTTVKATRHPRDVTTGHVHVSRERKDYKDGSTACLSVRAVFWNGTLCLSMALRRMCGTTVKFRSFWPWYCNDMRGKLNATDRFTLEKLCMEGREVGGWASQQIWTAGEETTFLLQAGIEPRIVQPVAPSL